MIKRLLFTLCLLLWASQAMGAAATYWVDGTNGSNINPCTDSASPLTTTAKQTWHAGIACMTPGNGDTLSIRTGTYTAASARISTGVISIPSGTSWANAGTIKAHTGEVVTIQPTHGGSCIALENVHYLIFQDIICDGVNNGTTTDAGIWFGTTDGLEASRTSRVRLQTVTVTNWFSNSFELYGHFNEIYNSSFTANRGTDSYGIYVTGHDNTLRGNTITGHGGFGIHNYCNGCNNNPQPPPSRNLYAANLIANNGAGKLNSPAGLLLSTGDSIVALNNVVRDNVVGGIATAHGASNVFIYNNTIVDNGTYGIAWDNQSGAVIKNNAIFGNGSVFSVGTGSVTRGNNGCESANTGCFVVTTRALAGFTNPGSNDYTLASGSALIDQGASSIGTLPPPLNSTLTALANGALPDIGAFESIPFASASATTTSVLDITFGAAYAPLSTVASCANVIVRQAGITKTCLSFVNNGNATFRWTCTTACLSGGTNDIDIQIAAGKFTDSVAIGNSLNQPNHALGITTVTNNIAGASEVFTSRHFRQRTWARATTDTIGAAWIKGEDAVGTVRVDNGKFSNLWSVDCTVADCPSVGFQFEFDYGANFAGTQTMPDTYANVADSCLTNPTCFDSTNSAAPHGAVISTSQLTDALGNYLAGAVAAQASSYPVLNLALNQSTQIQGNFAIKSGLSVGDRICIRPKLDSGAAINHAVTACFDIVNPAGSPA
jgi:parallel beta-helix repeat protein